MANLIQGHELQLFVIESGTTKTLAFAKSCSMSMNRDMTDISSKDSYGAKAEKPGLMSFTLSTNNLATVEDYKALAKKFINGDTIEFAFALVGNGITADETTIPDENGSVVPEGGWVQGDGIVSGKCSISSMDLNADDGSIATYTVNFNGIGRPVIPE